MSVLIKGMEMPEHCGVCRFAVDGWCYAYGKPNIDALANDGRTNFCPLVPVPPHGRLIDADVLYRRIKAECNPYGKPSIGYDDGLKVLGIIGSTPPVIPAEEGK